MKRRLTLSAMVVMALVCYGPSSTNASILFTDDGRSVSVETFPHDYKFRITTNGTDGRTGNNMGDWTIGNGNLVDLQISAWYDFTQHSAILLSGTLPGNALHLGSGTPYAREASWFEIGLVSRLQAERAADWIMVGMLEGGVHMLVRNRSDAASAGAPSGLTYEILAADTRSQSSSSLWFDPSRDLDYQFWIDNQTSSARLRVRNGDDWSSWVETAFGADNWGQAGYEDDLSQAALATQLYRGNQSLNPSSVTYGPITVTAVPEPTGLAIWALLGIAAWIPFRRGRKPSSSP